MPIWLQILIGILVCLAIIVCLYMIIAYRKVGIVSKKIDYLVEDLTYKSELLTPVIDSVVKIGSYIDLFEGIFQQKSESLLKYASNNKESIYKLGKQLKEVIKEK